MDSDKYYTKTKKRARMTKYIYDKVMDSDKYYTKTKNARSG